MDRPTATEVLALPPGHHYAEDQLSIGDAERETGVPRRELDHAMRTGRLPFTRATGWRWIKRRDLYTWLHRRELAGGTQ